MIFAPAALSVNAALVRGSRVVVPNVPVAVRIEVHHVMAVRVATVGGNRDDVVAIVLLNHEAGHRIAVISPVCNSVVGAGFIAGAVNCPTTNQSAGVAILRGTVVV